MNELTEEQFAGYRALVSALLLRGIRDARGYSFRAEVRRWISSPEAKRWAKLIDLPHWPPTEKELDE